MTIADMKTKPVEDGIILLDEAEFKTYVRMQADSLRKILPEEEVTRREEAMLSGKVSPTYFKWEVKCKPN
jgi:phosphate starvation-inducible protein PhoH